MTGLEPILAAALSGALIGLFLSVFGGGGSVLAAPLLVYAVGVRDPHVAIGTSAAAVAINALGGLLVHARAGRVKWPCALVFGGVGLAGSWIGSSLAKAFDGGRLLFLFAFAMAAVGLSMLRRPRGEGDPTVHLNWPIFTRLAPTGAATGLAAGFFGIGGGFLIVPGLVASTGMTLSNAAASSLVSVALFGAATSANYALSGLVDGPVLMALVVGGAVGTLAGAALGGLLARHALAARRAFAVLILIVAAYVAWRAWP